MTADTLTKDQSIELMQAEIERLRDVIDRAARAWLSLDPPVQWEGDVGDAMVAAVAEIERLRGNGNGLVFEPEGVLHWPVRRWGSEC